MFKLEEYDEDEIVVRQGDEGDSFYIILYGSVSIWLEPKEALESGSNSEGEYVVCPFYSPSSLPPSLSPVFALRSEKDQKIVDRRDQMTGK